MTWAISSDSASSGRSGGPCPFDRSGIWLGRRCTYRLRRTRIIPSGRNARVYTVVTGASRAYAGAAAHAPNRYYTERPISPPGQPPGAPRDHHLGSYLC